MIRLMGSYSPQPQTNPNLPLQVVDGARHPIATGRAFACTAAAAEGAFAEPHAEARLKAGGWLGVERLWLWLCRRDGLLSHTERGQRDETRVVTQQILRAVSLETGSILPVHKG